MLYLTLAVNASKTKCIVRTLVIRYPTPLAKPLVVGRVGGKVNKGRFHGNAVECSPFWYQMSTMVVVQPTEDPIHGS